MRITKLKNGNLLVPMRAETNGVIGDGVVEIKPGERFYKEYLSLWKEEQELKR